MTGLPHAPTPAEEYARLMRLYQQTGDKNFRRMANAFHNAPAGRPRREVPQHVILRVEAMRRARPHLSLRSIALKAAAEEWPSEKPQAGYQRIRRALKKKSQNSFCNTKTVPSCRPETTEQDKDGRNSQSNSEDPPLAA